MLKPHQLFVVCCLIYSKSLIQNDIIFVIHSSLLWLRSINARLLHRNETAKIILHFKVNIYTITIYWVKFSICETVPNYMILNTIWAHFIMRSSPHRAKTTPKLAKVTRVSSSRVVRSISPRRRRVRGIDCNWNTIFVAKSIEFFLSLQFRHPCTQALSADIVIFRRYL